MRPGIKEEADVRLTLDERFALLWAIEVVYKEEGDPQSVSREGWSQNAAGMLLDDVRIKLRKTIP